MPNDIPNIKTPILPPFAQILKERLRDDSYVREGDVVEAELIRKAPRTAFFDLGPYGTGVVYGQELLNARELVKKLEIGGRIAAKVVCLENDDGYVELSLTEADQQRLWQQIKELQESGEVIKVKIVGANSGGLMTTIIDLKAFLPVSRLSNDHYPKIDQNDRQKLTDELKKFIGEELSVKIIDVNPRTKKLIVSEREILAPNIKELLTQYQVGQEVDVMVSGIADFGVFVRFVDNPQIEGMVHVSELNHRLISNPKEVVKINEVLKVKIIDIREGRVFLSLKALQTDPWNTVQDIYKAGQEVKGEVYKFNPFGSVVNLQDGLQGIIHVSEFGGIEEMKKALIAGQTYTFIIDSIRPEEKRLILKLKK
ncbi:MAG: S1 RNA-binding domain-containing protein [Patescibacteria group bacterium]